METLLCHDRTVQALLDLDASNVTPDAVARQKDYVVVINADGRITLASKAVATKLLDEDTDAQVTGLWAMLSPRTAQAALSEAVKRAFQGQITQYWSDVADETPDSDGWDIRLSPVYASGKNVAAVLAIARQVTKH